MQNNEISLIYSIFFPIVCLFFIVQIGAKMLFDLLEVATIPCTLKNWLSFNVENILVWIWFFIWRQYFNFFNKCLLGNIKGAQSRIENEKQIIFSMKMLMTIWLKSCCYNIEHSPLRLVELVFFLYLNIHLVTFYNGNWIEMTIDENKTEKRLIKWKKMYEQVKAMRTISISNILSNGINIYKNKWFDQIDLLHKWDDCSCLCNFS